MKTSFNIGNYEVTVDVEDLARVEKYHWYVTKEKGNLYAIANVKVDGKATTLRMHRYIMRLPKGQPMLDHRDHNGLNNSKENLRICTNSQNIMNATKRVGNCPYKGVHKHTEADSYVARITKDGQRVHIGHFKTPEEAALAYNEKAKIMFGEFAYLNQVPT